MSSPLIYLGMTPPTAQHRRALREQALGLHAMLRHARDPAPAVALLHFAAGDAPPADAVDLLLIRQSALIVAAVRSFRGPLRVLPEGRWADAETGAPVDEGGRTPLQTVRAQRDAVRAALAARPDAPWHVPAHARILGAVACAPTMHAESRVSLDVDDHREGLKVLGLDELPGLAGMAQSGVRLAEPAMRDLAAEAFGGRLWHDGSRLLFELAAPRFQLRPLADERADQSIPLPEGETILGRRRTPRHVERRIPLAGDDLISSDHAALSYGDEETVTLRDMSKNGTWVALPGQPEIHLRGRDLSVPPGTVMRLGVTRLRLERLG